MTCSRDLKTTLPRATIPYRLALTSFAIGHDVIGQDSRACLCLLAYIYSQTGRSRFTRRQSMTEAVDFACPRCTSRYKLVRVRAESRLPSRLLHCRVCKEPLAATDGEYALKYFLVENANKRNNFDLRMQHVTSKRDKA